MSKSIKKSDVSAEGKKSVEKIPRKMTGKAKTTKQIMTRHIQDKNDVITDEEFKDLNLELDVTKDAVHEPLLISNDSERPKDEDKDKDKDPKVMTPWDVIK